MPDDLEARIRELPDVLSGRAPDPGGCVPILLNRVGLIVLGKVKEGYIQASQGGADAWGTPWPALSPTTLALRRIVTTPKAIARAKERFKKFSPEHQALVREHEQRITKALYSHAGKKAAIRVLQKKRRAGTITQQEYAKKVKLIEGQTKADAKARAKAVVAGAYALILRDTGRLLNSLSPSFAGNADQILRTGPGFVEVGSNVQTDTGLPLLALHTSPKARKQKRDGTGDVLPRRKVIPDDTADIPSPWMEAIRKEVAATLSDRHWWLAFLGGRAS